MEIVRSRGGVPIRLTDERWKHIGENHPETEGMRNEILATVAEPDPIQEGDSEELLAIRHYASTPLTSTFLVVPYRELTAYLTSVNRAKRWVWTLVRVSSSGWMRRKRKSSV